ncbi:MAG: hypothetical protein LPK07_02635 [Hymenobacteraceae bacterium]|nr:hypothetical protein [Hymenobacteraceae bacterium]
MKLWAAFWKVVIVLTLLPLVCDGQTRTWEVAVAGGAAHNFRTPLHISQQDAEKIRTDAQYRTEPLNSPVYYDIRVSSWHGSKGWELKFTHHKLILDNPPPEVQRFSITDGFNLLTLNRLWQLHGLTFSAGAGFVVTHPESTIRNKPHLENKGILHKGYYISGPTVEAAIAKRHYFAGRWFILGEGRLSASYVKVPVADGEARLSNIALHGLLGVGVRLGN